MAKIEDLNHIPSEPTVYPVEEGYYIGFGGYPCNPTVYDDEKHFAEFTEEEKDYRKTLWDLIESYIRPEVSKMDILGKLAFDTNEFGNRILMSIIERFDFSLSSRILLKQPYIYWQEYVSQPNIKNIQTLTTAVNPDKCVVISDGEKGDLIVAYL